MHSSQDIAYIRHALALARRGLGCVWPNPAVGCVLVKDGVIVARGWTQKGGRPHAEAVALQEAGEGARGACAYVSLEPCAHHGKTPPCAQALIDAGVSRVVVACGDPDERVSGRGVALLRAAGVEVLEGVCEQEARALNAGFFLRVEEKRPFVTLKTATSADSKIARADRSDPWITGSLARRHVHLMRSQSDAILVGVGTALADDPALTARLPGYDHSLVRIILDRRCRLFSDAKLFHNIPHDPLWIVCEKGNWNKELEQKGSVGIEVDDLRVETILPLLAGRGITRLFVEGGAQIYESFLQAGMVDELLCYRAPYEIGPEGLAAFTGEIGLPVQKIVPLGEDSLEIYRREE